MPSLPLSGSSANLRPNFASELCTHRNSLQQVLQEWTEQQDLILERALAVFMHGDSLKEAEGNHTGLKEAQEDHTGGHSSVVCNINGDGKCQTSCDICISNGDSHVPLKDAWLVPDVNDTCFAPNVASIVNGEHDEAEEYACMQKKQSFENEPSRRQTPDSMNTINFLNPAESDEGDNIRSQASALGFHRKKTEGLDFFHHQRLIGSCVYSIVESKRFETVCALVIFLNAILLGASSDYAMTHLGSPEHPTLSAFELAFSIFYAVEVILRISGLGRSYFNSADWQWNVFDLGLVLMSIWDQIEARLILAGGGSAMKNLSFLRMLRLMKMLKLLRMVRLMRMFRELRLILHSVLGCVQAMFWAMVLIITISYMFGICFLQACTSYLESTEPDQVDPDDAEGINEYWGSIGSAMLSLYLAATAGKEWAVMSKPLKTVGWPFFLLFLIYIAFFSFVVMNTVTSLFLEATLAQSDKDNQMVIQRELERKTHYIDKLQAFYDEMDDDQDGAIGFDEFCNHINSPEMRAFATSLEIDVMDAKQFFCILSGNGRRAVDVETFVVGCIKLRGFARSMDLMDLLYSHREFRSEARTGLQDIREGLDQIGSLIKSSCNPADLMTMQKQRKSSWPNWTSSGSEDLPATLSTKGPDTEVAPRKPEDEERLRSIIVM